MSKRPVVVYTAIIGGYDRSPVVADASPDVEFILASDDSRVRSPWKRSPWKRSPWKPVSVDRYWQDDKLTSGYVKTHPHLFAPPDAISVWVDANLDRIRIDSGRIRDLVRSSPVATFPHLTRDSVSEEAFKVIESELDVGWRVGTHMNRLRSLGFSDDVELSATMFVVRDLGDPRQRLFNEQWWKMILGGSRRDQLGFDAAGWITGVEIDHLDADWREPNEWFVRREHSNPAGRRIESTSDVHNAALNGFNFIGLPDDFPDPPYYEEEWTARDLMVNQALNAVVEQSGEALEGNYGHMHHARLRHSTPPDPRRSWKREYLRRAITGVQTYLEVGFNAGHSAAIALLENHEVRVTAVDLASHSYTRGCARVLADMFPGRIELRFGDSRSVLQLSQGWRASDYDLVHIDGGHGPEVFGHDLDWWVSTSKPGCRLLVDDSYVPHISATLETEVVAARIRESDPGLPSSGENQLYVRI